MPNVELTMSNHQRAELRFRARANVLSAGGRGSGKSRNLVHALFAHCEEFGGDARPLVCREERNALLQLFALIYELAVKVYGPAVARNLNDSTITLPSGAQILLTNIADDTTYARLQGMTFSAVLFDELGNYHATAYAFAQRLRSNLRVPLGRRPMIWATANPHGRSHGVLFKHFITKSAPWVPWVDEHGDTWVWTQSTVDDNPFVDGENYKLQLAASTGGDAALARAWTLGEWGALGGNMWDNFNPTVHVITGLPYLPGKPTWRLGCDWGTAAPFVALLGVEVPADVPGYTPGSVIIVDEVDSVASPDNLNVGTGMAPDAAADYIIQMCNRHGVDYKTGAIDDAKGLQGETVISLMQGRYLYLHKPYKKDRAGGWLAIRQRLESARTGDGPGLYIHARCVNLIESLANAPRDVRRVEDVDHRYPDHHLDAARYLLTEYTQGKAVFGRTVGMI